MNQFVSSLRFVSWVVVVGVMFVALMATDPQPAWCDLPAAQCVEAVQK